MSDITILIPAAGNARRMRGADKLTETIGGLPLLRRQASEALATGQQVVVTLPPAAHPHHAGRLAALAGLPVIVEEVADAAEGLAASIRQGMVPIGHETQGVMVFLPDLPEIDAGDIDLLVARFLASPGHSLRATAADGQPGHPAILPRRLFGQLSRLTGDTGAREILRDEAKQGLLRLVPLEGARATIDLDTPEDWEAWRRKGQ